MQCSKATQKTLTVTLKVSVGEGPAPQALFISISRASAGSAGKSPVEILPHNFISSNFRISFEQVKD
jgi:hypothetical protein